MSRAYDLYGFGGYPRDYVDDRHLLLCPGCHVCQAAEARAERDANRAARTAR